MNRDKLTLGILIGFIVLLACAITAVLVYIFFGDQLFGAGTSTPTLSAESDPVWDRIQQNGKMVVGISADYPPFEYIDENFAIVGYDLALMQGISQRLDIPLDFRNMAFDGLLNALQIGQIDVAVSAITYTPERDAYIDFSNVYYSGEAVVLARADSTLQIGKPEELAAYRVGVQRGSSYEDWMNDTLVAPGSMPPQNLHTYQTAQELLNALVSANPEVDVVLSDSQPAELVVQTQPVKIIARGINPQGYAIAIPQGAVALQSYLNQALTEMQNDGTLALLAKQYLNIDNPPPLPTPAPTQPPATPEGCLDGMKYIEDINYPDYNMTKPQQFPPGVAVQKGWRIQNTGTCVWDSRYVLSYTSSNPPNAPVGGNPVAIQGQVAPGQIYEIYATITAPAQPGRYQSFWNLRNANSQYFGDRLWIGLEVVAPVTPTPGPTAPAIYRFDVLPSQIVQGQCVNISWQFGGQSLASSRIFRNNQVILVDLPYTGTASDCPPGSGPVEYRLQIDSTTTGSAVAAKNIYVITPSQPTDTPRPPEQPPVIYFFNVDSNEIDLGQCINMSWQYTATSVVNAQISRDNQAIASNVNTSGSLRDCPTKTGQLQYRLRVDTEFTGSTQASQFVQVNNPQPAQPQINSFTAQPADIMLGECVDLRWDFTSPSQSTSELTRNGQSLASSLSFTGGFRDCINDNSLIGQVTYTLKVAAPPGGGTASANQIIEVIGPEPP